MFIHAVAASSGMRYTRRMIHIHIYRKPGDVPSRMPPDDHAPLTIQHADGVTGHAYFLAEATRTPPYAHPTELRARFRDRLAETVQNKTKHSQIIKPSTSGHERKIMHACSSTQHMNTNTTMVTHHEHTYINSWTHKQLMDVHTRAIHGHTQSTSWTHTSFG